MRKGEVRRQSIMAAAERLFCARGYAETTVDDILRELQCSKGSFYHYFDSKLAVLTAVCQDKVCQWFDAYKKTRITSTRQRLNALLRCTHPFQAQEEDFLFMLLRLRARGECAAMEGAMRAAQRELVKPEIATLLMILCETGQAHLARPRMEDLVFELHIALYDEICETLARCAAEGTPAAQPFREAVEAARFLWERTLDMDYGSMEIIPLDEMLPVAERLVYRLRTI